MRKSVICVLLAICLIIGLTGCGKEQEVSPSVSVAETTEVPEITLEPTEVTVSEAQTEPEAPAVVVGFLPTNKPWQYVAIADQEAAVIAAEKAVNAIYSDEWWIKGDRTNGLQVEYKGEIWTFVESGELVYPLGRVRAEDAADLLALCEEAARAAGWKEAVKPEQISGIVSATLRSKGNEYPLTDAAALEKLETGEVLTIALAIDSCGAWMSEGYYYEYGNDSQPLFDLFGVTLEELAPWT